MIISVDLEGRSYPIHIEAGGLEGLGQAVADVLPPGPAIVVSNTVVGPLYMAAARASLEAAGFKTQEILIPDGEERKTLETWQQLVLKLLELGVKRSTPVLALGGGVTGDIVAFAASTVLRGVPLVQVPTTLLSMVDSSVGGKTGVNVPSGKNLVGSFYQPRLVYSAMSTLLTLEAAELRSGLGEVVKHGVLGDPTLFALCEARAPQALALDGEIIAEMVARSCRVKAAVVAQDELETGLRATLNLGHTVGHAIETALGHGTLRHGECVGLGLIAEVRWAGARGACAPATVERVRAAVEALGLPRHCPPVSQEALLRAAGFDKKASRGMIHTAVVEGIGVVRLEAVGLEELPKMLSHLDPLLASTES